MSRIVFLLPGSGHAPVGGFKVTYEYAQGLASRGHAVNVAHASMTRSDLAPLQRIKGTLGWLRRRATGYRPDRWFRWRADVALLWVPRLTPRLLAGRDVVVATSWETAEWLGTLPARASLRRLYLIQHLETWSGDSARVLRTWRLPLEKIVIARWLEEMAIEMGERAWHIPNGLDLDAFGVDVPIEERNPASIAALWHPARWKGCDVAIEALALARKTLPELQATFFGVSRRPAALP